MKPKISSPTTSQHTHTHTRANCFSKLKILGYYPIFFNYFRKEKIRLKKKTVKTKHTNP
jgi:hypothetical protein